MGRDHETVSPTPAPLDLAVVEPATVRPSRLASLLVCKILGLIAQVTFLTEQAGLGWAIGVYGLHEGRPRLCLVIFVQQHHALLGVIRDMGEWLPVCDTNSSRAFAVPHGLYGRTVEGGTEGGWKVGETTQAWPPRVILR